MDFSNRFTKVIEHSELSPAEFAEEIGVQRSSISHIISGRNKPSLDFITKIKTAFPDFEWNWLITGEGEMLISEKAPEPIVEEKPEVLEKKKPSLPDLFSLINDENFGITESEDKVEKSKSRDSNISSQVAGKNVLSDSQTLENSIQKQDSKKKNVKRIVFFYEDGTFETFEN
ncbi:helix-turn-helix domain-containing protein [Chryseobacterium sp. FH1]|uniref:helix-turn-helix domain-containing protein n=1 Tax=Chryseobacterium sp. FH1 TaxID=1233951 RepID=UPI0004E418DE|nr:helix-turn-helix transcriptional regulator [Chryseobacterium sp. FH1]KFC20672.1 hypothetical protein IO90_16165 [Chryseobacterium sp. FH1]